MDNPSTISLGRFIDNYCAHTFNDSQKHYDNYLVIAQHLYGELQRNTLRVTRKRKVQVELGLNIVYMPGDVHRLVRLFYIDDCNKEVTIHPNANYSIMETVTARGCGCKKCDCTSSTCGSVNSIAYEEEDVLVHDDVTYKKVIKTKVQSNGDILREITEPFLKKNNVSSVVYKTKTQRLETLTVKPCGCIIESIENREKCISACGITICSDICEDDKIISSKNKKGYVVDAEKRIIHITGFKPKEIGIQYVSNGSECDAETMIDVEEVEALLNGLYWGSIRFVSSVSELTKSQAQKRWERSKQELLELRNPIQPERLLEIQNTFFKWV